MERILVVEDSPTQAQEIRLLLEDAGYAVDIAYFYCNRSFQIGEGVVILNAGKEIDSSGGHPDVAPRTPRCSSTLG